MENCAVTPQLSEWQKRPVLRIVDVTFQSDQSEDILVFKWRHQKTTKPHKWKQETGNDCDVILFRGKQIITQGNGTKVHFIWLQ